MAFPGETIASGAPSTCSECKKKLVNEVLLSGAGYYIGTRCFCGPYSRESDYYKTRDQAEKALLAGGFERDTSFKPGGLKALEPFLSKKG